MTNPNKLFIINNQNIIAPIIDLEARGSSGTWMFIATVDDETSDVAKVEFLGEVTGMLYEWEYTGASRGDLAQAIVYDNAGNTAESEMVDSHSQSLGQSHQPVRMLFIQFLERLLERFPALERILFLVFQQNIQTSNDII